MIYLLTLLTLLSLGILIVLFLKNMELKEQINKSWKKMQIIFQIKFRFNWKVLLRQTNWKRQSN